MIQSIVAEINIKTGESECHYYKERLLYLEESQRDLLIDSSRILSCHGELKNNRGAVSLIHTNHRPCLDLFVYWLHPDPTVTIYNSSQMQQKCFQHSCDLFFVFTQCYSFWVSFLISKQAASFRRSWTACDFTYYTVRAFHLSTRPGDSEAFSIL